MKFNLLTYLLALLNFTMFGQTPELRKFDEIIAVNDETNGKWESYYLTKAGKMFGNDSLEFYDNSPVCESEGFITFRDRKTDKAGMFNRNGDIVIGHSIFMVDDIEGVYRTETMISLEESIIFYPKLSMECRLG